MTVHPRDELVLPPDLTMGVATAAWQIEGSSAGRGRSIWDDFADVPGAIRDGATGEPACDHVRRLSEDLDLLGWLGVDAYRFSVSWPRVMPEGRGAVSAEGLDFYDRLVDGLLDRGIAPAATLFHWDLPSSLQAAGGWPARDTIGAFADYAEAVGTRLSDRVERWATINEPWCPAYLGHAAGVHAPGIKDPLLALRAAYHLMVGHAHALDRLRATGARTVGIAPNLIPAIAEDEESVPAAEHVDGLQNRFFLDLLAGKGIPTGVLRGTSSITDWSFVRDEDLSAIAAPIDWLGENYYTVMRVKAGLGHADAVGQDMSMFPGAPDFHFVPRPPFTEMGWEVEPGGLLAALRMAADALPGVPLYITENGAAVADVREADGVHDDLRIDYLRHHLQMVLAARAEGLPVEGYFAWSMLDNLEWAEGWTKPFGLIRVEPATGERVPKDSAHWWRSLLAARHA